MTVRPIPTDRGASVSDDARTRARGAPARPATAGRAAPVERFTSAAVGPRRRADAGARRPGRPPVVERALGRLPRRRRRDPVHRDLLVLRAGAARDHRAAPRQRGRTPSRSPPSSAATTCTRPTARAATARTARAASGRRSTARTSCSPTSSVDYLNNVLVVGGRYVCGNPNSLMPVWSNEGHPPGPLNYIQIEDLIAFIRAPIDQTYTIRDPELGEPKIDPITGEVRTFKGWVDPAYKPAPGATPYPACWTDEFATASGSPAASGRSVGLAGAVGLAAARARRPPRRRPRPRRETGSAVKITASGIAFDDAGGDGPGRHAVRHRLRQPGRVDAAQRRDQGLDRARSSSRATSSPASRRSQYQVPALAAGTYPFMCTVHPNMTGTLTAQ